MENTKENISSKKLTIDDLYIKILELTCELRELKTDMAFLKSNFENLKVINKIKCFKCNGSGKLDKSNPFFYVYHTCDSCTA